MPGFARLLGMVSESADRRRASFQELQLSQRERDDVRSRDIAVRQSGHDAAIPADARGLHIDPGGISALGRGRIAAVYDACGRGPDDQASGPLPHRLWLAGAFAGHVLLDSTT